MPVAIMRIRFFWISVFIIIVLTHFQKAVGKETIIVSRITQTPEGKAYLEVDGKPFLYNAVQSWFPPEADYEIYINKAAEVNYKIFSFWLLWKNIEPEEDKYDWTTLDRVIDLSNKYSMRLDIVWGGSIFCGALDPRFTPDFIRNDYSILKRDEYGNLILVKKGDMGLCHIADFSKEEIFQKEKKCIKAMMEHLRDYDTNHRVIFFQVENEPNLQNWCANQKSEILEYLNRIGGVIKSSPYRVATRVNLAGINYDPEIEKLYNIDCHGVDPYKDDIELIRSLIRTETKMPHIAENAAWTNSSSLIVTALANSGFYSIYRLDYDYIWKKPGVYGDGWIYLIEPTYDIKILNMALNKISQIITVSFPSEMLEFNTEKSQPESSYSSRKEFMGRTIGFKSFKIIEDHVYYNAPVGLVISYEGDFYCLADDRCYFTVDIEPEICESGYFDEDTRWHSVQKRKYRCMSDSEYQIDYLFGDCLRIKMIFLK